MKLTFFFSKQSNFEAFNFHLTQYDWKEIGRFVLAESSVAIKFSTKNVKFKETKVYKKSKALHEKRNREIQRGFSRSNQELWRISRETSFQKIVE